VSLKNDFAHCSLQVSLKSNCILKHVCLYFFQISYRAAKKSEKILIEHDNVQMSDKFVIGHYRWSYIQYADRQFYWSYSGVTKVLCMLTHSIFTRVQVWGETTFIFWTSHYFHMYLINHYKALLFPPNF
jgi:hypothetical protein